MSDPPFLPILGRVPSGIFILTIKSGDQETGMLASWVMQAGFEPPMVSLAVKQGRYVTDWLTEGCPFVLNILRDGQSSLLGHFGRGFEPGQDAFEGLELDRSGAGVPILRDALGHLECEPGGHLDSGDHRIFLATVTGGCLAENLADDAKPMVHIRKSGQHY